MKRSGVVLAGWGTLLLIYTAIEGLAFAGKPIELAMLGGGGFAMVVLGALSAATQRPGLGPTPDTGEPRPLPDLSVASVVLALGLAMAIAGIELGPWLIFIGGGTAAFGVGGLVREFRAERRMARGT